MPFVRITTAKKIDEATKNALNLKIGELMPVIPGKDKDNTLLCIDDGVSMFKGGKPNDGVFATVQCYKKSPEESKKEFALKFYEIIKETLGLGSESCVYMNFAEFENWASNGNYF